MKAGLGGGKGGVCGEGWEGKGLECEVDVGRLRGVEPRRGVLVGSGGANTGHVTGVRAASSTVSPPTR